MNGVLGQKGYADYVLFGKDGLPLAVIEAKRTGKDPNNGRKQACLYADCLERKFGRRPMMFTSNGFDTYFWDDLSSPQRKVSGFFTKSDLEKMMGRRETRRKLNTIAINDKITDRYYQKEAIRAVCDHIEQGFRKALLVMATGTGKTRTAASLTDVLSRGGYITNILFLADRTALVKQARDDFKNYLPDMSLCNLCSNKDDRNARIVFSTYPTILNAIDSTKTIDGIPLFSPAHFDLIITDESHRSIFKKYRAIFEYFDAITVGLTATPKIDVDRNTYDFFEVENGVPTYAYDYETAVYTDHVLVPYYNYEVKTKFLDEGITYNDLTDEDKERYEDDFAEDGYMPEFIPSAALNKFVFNENTVDTVLQDLMERGIKNEGGDRLGKTIIFAQNKEHAEYIVQRFNKLYPKYNGTFAHRVTCDDSYSQTIIDDFKIAAKPPFIAVSVDMMDTGIDVPECVNLVFFKKVRSKTKFWQMIGRGTRLCKGLDCIDQIHKRKQYKSLTLVRQEKKTNNRQVFLNIELLDEAIQNERQVSFSYLQYGTDKKLHKRRKEPYIVNPYGMVFLNEHYYLVCNLLGKPCTSLYRIDRIKDISVLDSEWDKQPENDSEVENAVYAFSGKAEYIKLRCDKVILNDAVDQFGMSAKIRDLNESEFEMTVKVPPRGVKFWALQYLPYVEVIEPLWLREEVIESIKGNKYDV